MAAMAPPLLTILDLDPARDFEEISVGTPQLDFILKAARTPVDQSTQRADQAEALLNLTPSKQLMEGGLHPQLEFVARVMCRRLAVYRPACVYSGPMLGAAAALTRGNPGRGVQWAHAMAAWHARTGQPATLGTLLVGRLDGCYPTDAALLRLWDAQKLSPEEYRRRRAENSTAMDNQLDYREAWEDEALLAGARASSG